MKDNRSHFRRVIHTSLRPFVNSSPADFPASDRRIGVVARSGRHPTHARTMVEVEVEIPSFVSSCRGEYVEIEEADGIVRARLLQTAKSCREIAQELVEHAERMEEEALKEEVMEEVETEVMKKEEEDTETVGDGPTFATAGGGGVKRRSKGKPGEEEPTPTKVKQTRSKSVDWDEL